MPSMKLFCRRWPLGLAVLSCRPCFLFHCYYGERNTIWNVNSYCCNF